MDLKTIDVACEAIAERRATLLAAQPRLQRTAAQQLLELVSPGGTMQLFEFTAAAHAVLEELAENRREIADLDDVVSGLQDLCVFAEIEELREAEDEYLRIAQAIAPEIEDAHLAAERAATEGWYQQAGQTPADDPRKIAESKLHALTQQRNRLQDAAQRAAARRATLEREHKALLAEGVAAA